MVVRDDGWFIDKTKKILDNLNTEMYPETADYLQGLIDDYSDEDMIDDMFDDEQKETSHDIAIDLCDLDKGVDWTPELIEFITELLMHEIDKGNAAAMNDLGIQYYDGNRGFEQSFEKAMKYYKMAAYNGDRPAQENRGYCYYYGRDGEVNYEKAFNYFALGAFDGHLISLYKIGDMYYNGYYVEQNYKEAFFIYMRCLEMMTEEAERKVAGPVYLRLGKMFLNGQGTEKNLKSALACFQKAEFYLCAMVIEDGDYMYKKSLYGAIEGQQKVREELAEMIPEKDWVVE